MPSGRPYKRKIDEEGTIRYGKGRMVYLTTEQDETLLDMCEAHKKSISAIIREGIILYKEKTNFKPDASNSKKIWKEYLMNEKLKKGDKVYWSGDKSASVLAEIIWIGVDDAGIRYLESAFKGMSNIVPLKELIKK